MGLFLSILYFLTYYLTPTTIFGPLAIYRMELLIAASVLLVSLPSLQGSFLLKTPQLWALIGLGVAALLSVVVGVHWVGGALPAVLLFIPNAYAYLLVCLHCNSKKKLQVLVLTLLFVCLFVIARGLIQMGSGSAPTETEAHQVNSSEDSYLMAMDNGAGAWFYRLRGQGEIHDPNDFAQLIACVVPLVLYLLALRRDSTERVACHLAGEWLAIRSVSDSFAWQYVGLCGDGDRCGPSPHRYVARAIAGGGALRCGNSPPFHRREGHFSRCPAKIAQLSGVRACS